jgi:uracil DNA glycosylase
VHCLLVVCFSCPQWCSQGVLLLNAALTVRAKNSNSHAGRSRAGYRLLQNAGHAPVASLHTDQQGDVLLFCGSLASCALALMRGCFCCAAGKGWEAFTSAALTALAKKRSGIVFLLWGK